MSTISRRDVLGSAAALGGLMALNATAFAQQTPATQPAQPGAQPPVAPPAGAQPAQPGAQPPAAPPPAGQPGETIEGPYTLPPLPYGYGDLEPFLNVQTLKLHHDIHFAGYVKGANQALADLENVRRQGGETVKTVRAILDNLAFNGSGAVLHQLYFSSMMKNGGGDPPADSDIAKMILRDFGSFRAFRESILAPAAAQVHGSGWAVLVYEPFAQRLMVLQAEKHENATIWGSVPLLALDVWEHAYYLQYQNKRTDYVKAFMDVINWQFVNQRLQSAMTPTAKPA